jgi:hypothetical protein
MVAQHGMTMVFSASGPIGLTVSRPPGLVPGCGKLLQRMHDRENLPVNPVDPDPCTRDAEELREHERLCREE